MVLDKEKNLAQRLEFIRLYARWVKATPNEVWSRQQALLVNSMVENARNFALPVKKYLELKERGKANKPDKADK